MTAEHPARAAGRRAMELEESKGEHAKQRWLALFADDAIIEDPIGPSPVDPEGKGHRAKEGISAFWDLFITPHQLKFDIARSYAVGNEVAFVGTVTASIDGRTLATVDGVFTYKINAAGKIVAYRAYWEFEQMTPTAEGQAMLEEMRRPGGKLSPE